MNEQDLTAATLAALVGSELRAVDTMSDGKLRANRLDPRIFLHGKQQQKNKNVAYQDGKAFYAGIDESYVQSLYPDPAPLEPRDIQQNEAANINPIAVNDITSKSVDISNEQFQVQKTIVSNSTQEASITEVLKVLKSIDKSLKSLVKNSTTNQTTTSDKITN